MSSFQITMAKKMIIDCDAGIDDCQAIMLVLAQPDWEILGITCVSGNTSLDNVWRNVLRVLKICGRSEIPVFKGASHPLLFSYTRSSSYYGDDGLGGYANNVTIDESLIKSEHATSALIRLVNQYPGEVTLIALAPLTNLALTHRLEPSFSQKLKHLCIMGGNTSARGNSAIAAEFNFLCDPESAHIILTEFLCSKLIVPWETCISPEHILDWAWCHKWISTDTTKGHFLKGITKNVIKDLKEGEGSDSPGMHSCDLLAMAAAVNSSVIKELVSGYSQVELYGKVTRGQMVTDWNNILEKPNNVVILLKIDLICFKNMCEKMLQ